MLANEASWTRHDQLAVIRAGAADVVSVDNQMDGGLLNLKRSAGLCEAAGLPVVKHSLGELRIALAAATHALAATPNFRFANQAYGALLADDVTADFGGPDGNYRDGHLDVPTGPGLGVVLARDKVERYAELYRTKGADFSFTTRDADAPLRRCPKPETRSVPDTRSATRPAGRTRRRPRRRVGRPPRNQRVRMGAAILGPDVTRLEGAKVRSVDVPALSGEMWFNQVAGGPARRFWHLIHRPCIYARTRSGRRSTGGLAACSHGRTSIRQ